MAWPDFTDLKYRVRDLLNEATAGFFLDAQIGRWLNEGERDVAIKGLCLEDVISVTTVANTRTVAAPYNKVMFVEYVESTWPVGLIKITPSHVGNLPFEPGNVPQAWFPWGKNIGIEPIPQAAYTLNLYVSKLPAYEMSDGTDEPQIPDGFVGLIVRYAYIRGLWRDRLFRKAANEYQMYLANLQHIRDSVIQKYKQMAEAVQIPHELKVVK